MGQDFQAFLASLSEPWSNQACVGYAAICCRNLGYTQGETEAFLHQLSLAFSNYTLEEAANYG